MFTNILVNAGEELSGDHRCAGGHADPELRPDADGAVLCAVPSDLYHHLSEVLPPCPPHGQQRPDGCEHLPVRKPIRYEGHPDIQPGAAENGRISGSQQAPWEDQDGTGCSSSASSGRMVYMLLHQLRALFLLYIGGKGYIEEHDLPGSDA